MIIILSMQQPLPSHEVLHMDLGFYQHRWRNSRSPGKSWTRVRGRNCLHDHGIRSWSCSDLGKLGCLQPLPQGTHAMAASHYFSRPQRSQYVLHPDRKLSRKLMRVFSVSGQMILMLEDGTEHLVDQPGSVIIQRGTMHAWRNPGPGWTRWMCVLVDANPAVVNGKSLGTKVGLA